MHFAVQDQVFWFLKKRPLSPLRRSLKTDVVVIGGGMAGLSAAQAFHERGLSVVLLEQYYCGSGASGKTSGFITPDSEIPLSGFVERYGLEQAKKLWEFALSGVEHIRNTIIRYNLACDYQVQDTLVVASNKRGIKELEDERKARQALSYESTWYTTDQLPQVLKSSGYFVGIKYGGSFGINSYRYCQELKELLHAQGMHIYEETPVLEIADGKVYTDSYIVEADHIIVCADRWIPEIGTIGSTIAQVQTFLLISSPLTDQEIMQLFPQERCMVWDTELLYNYYRLTGDNRLLLGGSNLWFTYASQETHNSSYMAHKLITYFRKKFPQLPVEFVYMWPGLIGVSKDFRPVAGRDNTMKTVYYVGAAAGLPWAAATGLYSAAHMLDGRTDLDEYFSPYRSFTIDGWMQKFLGKKISFALSHLSSLQSF